MAVAVKSGQYIEASLAIKNVGLVAGEFLIKSVLAKAGTNERASWFYPTKNYTQDSEPLNIAVTINPGETKTITLYSGKIGAFTGQSLNMNAYAEGLQFDVVWYITDNIGVINSNIRDMNVIQYLGSGVPLIVGNGVYKIAA